MHIEDFKTWHWMVLGPIIGLIYGCLILYRGPSSDVPGILTVDQGRFERAVAGAPSPRIKGESLIAQYPPGKPLIKDLVVHPPMSDDPSGTYWVTGRMYSVEYRKDSKDPQEPQVVWAEWTRFRYAGKAPYRAVLTVAGGYHDVAEFLKAARVKSPEVAPTYQYAWWDNSTVTLVMPAFAGLLIIGIAWPMTINLMQGAGLAPVPQKKVKLPKNRPTAARPVIDHKAGDEQLSQLNEQMEQDLAAASVSLTESIDAGAKKEAPIRLLSSGAEVGASEHTAEQERLIREYGGEFYPVVKKIHKEGEEEAPQKPH